MEVIFDEYSNTLRQMPENYLLAQKTENGWLCNPDLAANKELAIITFKHVALIYRNKWQMRGEYLADTINKRFNHA